MKIFLPNESKQQIGGGWSFLNSLKKGISDSITENYDEADVVCIVGASVCKPEVAEDAKRAGKKVVLRTDNFLRHSRNGGKGMDRMQRMAAVADLVVYQCEWAKSILDDFLGRPNSTIIYNGVDLDIFKPEGDRLDFRRDPVYLYAASSKGENKGWDICYYEYVEIQKREPDAMLLVVGKIPTAVLENNLDFFQGENYRYLGMVDSPERMSTIYRSATHLICPFQYDCYSNTAVEAWACGLELTHISPTGGMLELLENLKKGREFNSLERMTLQFKESIMAL